MLLVFFIRLMVVFLGSKFLLVFPEFSAVLAGSDNLGIQSFKPPGLEVLNFRSCASRGPA